MAGRLLKYSPYKRRSSVDVKRGEVVVGASAYSLFVKISNDRATNDPEREVDGLTDVDNSVYLRISLETETGEETYSHIWRLCKEQKVYSSLDELLADNKLRFKGHPTLSYGVSDPNTEYTVVGKVVLDERDRIQDPELHQKLLPFMTE